MRVFTPFYRSLLIVLCLAITGTSWAMPDFETFFAQHSTPMWMINVDSGIIERANPAAEAFYGFKQLEGMPIGQINMLNSAQLNDEIRRAAEANRNHLYFRHRLADGSVKVMGIYSDRFEIDGREVLISSLYDTSDFDASAERHYIQRIEEQVDLQTAELHASRQRIFWISTLGTIFLLSVIAILIIIVLRLRVTERENKRLINELSFRNRELERLSQVMAHHFQEPSRRLVSFAQQLSKQLGSTLDSSATISLEFIETQARRLSDLVSDVQRYLSLESGPAEQNNLDPVALIETVYYSSKALATARDANILTIKRPLPWVYADARQLRMIFHILLHNSWLYRDDQRPLKVEISAQLKNKRVYFYVTDNGIGIPAEYRDQAVGMFSRLVPNSERYPGTGMGLALVVKALRCIDGHLRIEDGQASGATFIFDLPAGR